MRLALRILLLAMAFALATFIGGWWALPIVGALWGLVRSGGRWAGIEAGVAAAASWALILAWTSTLGPLGQVAEKAGAIMGLGPVVLYIATVLFAALAAGAAAGLLASLATRKHAIGSSAG